MVGPTRPHNPQQLLITSQPRLVLLDSPDGRFKVFYDRVTDGFYTATPEKKPDRRFYEEDEEQSPFLMEARRLANSVCLIYLYGARCIDSLS